MIYFYPSVPKNESKSNECKLWFVHAGVPNMSVTQKPHWTLAKLCAKRSYRVKRH